MKEENRPNKHLTYEERKYIEIGLNDGRNFTQIAKDLKKDRTTISREVQKHRFKKEPSGFNNSKNMCKHRMKCQNFECTKEKECYEEEVCKYILGTPYVCNGCESKGKCRKTKYYYYSKIANEEYLEKLSASRIGVNITKDEVYEIDKLLTSAIKEKKQPITHLYNSYPDQLFFSRTTMYNYINLGIFTVKNIDLQRRVKYKKRKESTNQKIRRETAIRKGRTYEDYGEYMKQHIDASVVEMDTVEGIKGGKIFLTLLIRKYHFMLIYVMDNKTMECVEKCFESIKAILGKELYKKVFEVVLTDNGSEFFNPYCVELFEGENTVNLFYCDPNASWQKGAIEKNHEYIRYVLPKGSSFDELTQSDVNLLMSNINSTCRNSLNGKTPYNAVRLLLDTKILKKLGVNKIKPAEVSLSPNLLKGGDKDAME